MPIDSKAAVLVPSANQVSSVPPLVCVTVKPFEDVIRRVPTTFVVSDEDEVAAPVTSSAWDVSTTLVVLSALVAVL